MSVKADKKRRKELGNEMRQEVQSYFESATPVWTVWKDGRSFVGTPDNYKITAKENGEKVSFSVERFSSFRIVVQKETLAGPAEKSSFSAVSEAIEYGKDLLN
jgi:hypothetical protein